MDFFHDMVFYIGNVLSLLLHSGFKVPFLSAIFSKVERSSSSAQYLSEHELVIELYFLFGVGEHKIPCFVPILANEEGKLVDVPDKDCIVEISKFVFGEVLDEGDVNLLNHDEGVPVDVEHNLPRCCEVPLDYFPKK